MCDVYLGTQVQFIPIINNYYFENLIIPFRYVNNNKIEEVTLTEEYIQFKYNDNIISLCTNNNSKRIRCVSYLFYEYFIIKNIISYIHLYNY